ncbi:MAG TPA: hypothetical protein VLW55_00275 [Burkholderiaceae bacterium]|nr:hypothetical protein [Burkholderiaceae bacterium]
MREETEVQILEVLREMRDGQREALRVMEEHRALVEEQIKTSRKTIEESVGLQRLAVKRQQLVLKFAAPAIGICILAIGYLLLRFS